MKEAQADILYEIQHIYFQILEFTLEYPVKVSAFPDFLPLFISASRAINRKKSLHHFITVVVVIKCELQTSAETLGLSG